MLRETEEIFAEALSDPEGRMMLLELLAELLSPPLGPHIHRCGFDRDPTRSGCGHTWGHDGRETDKAPNKDVYDQLHACPKCGRGPWKLQLTPEAEEAIAQERNV